MENEELHCFENEHTVVVAANLEEARSKWDEWTFFSPDGLDEDDISDEHEIHQISDDRNINIEVEDELKNKPDGVVIKDDSVWTATAKAWAQSQGKGFLCSSEY